jgi:hypothetical protein
VFFRNIIEGSFCEMGGVSYYANLVIITQCAKTLQASNNQCVKNIHVTITEFKIGS